MLKSLPRSSRDFLLLGLRERNARNSKYTMRAFARDLGVSAPQLSRLIRGKKGISISTANQIANRLCLDAVSKLRFIDMVEAEFSRSPYLKAEARRRLDSQYDYQELNRKIFDTFSSWHHLSILCLTELPNFQESADWIADRLSISAREADEALQRLIAIGLLERSETGRLQLNAFYYANVSGLPSRAVRMFHKGLLERAIDSLEQQNTRERQISSFVMAVDDSQLEEAKADILRFQKEFDKKYGGKISKKNSVYAFSTQYFRLSKECHEAE